MPSARTGGSTSSCSASATTATRHRCFPGLAAVTEQVRTVAASYVEVVGMWRITLTPPAINAARNVAFLVAGDGKAQMLHRVLQGRRQPIVLPAQAVRPTDGALLWLVDAASAAHLQPAPAR